MTEGATVEVRVLIYLDRTGEGWVWWAESPDVPGFYAAEDTLPALLVRSELAVRDTLSEEYDVEDVTVHPELVGAPPPSEGVEIEQDVPRPLGERRVTSVASVGA